MYITIDLDGVALDYNESRSKVVEPVLRRMNLNSIPVCPGAYSISETYGITEEEGAAVAKVVDHEILRQEKPKKYAVEVLTRLKSKGFNFIVITRRCGQHVLKYMDGKSEFCGDLCERQVKEFFPAIFDKVITTEDKLQACIDNKVCALFDDELVNLTPCLGDSGVLPIAMNSQYNQYGESLLRVNDWLEFEKLILKVFENFVD